MVESVISMAHFSKNPLISYIRRLLNIFGLWPGATRQRLYHVYSYNLHIIVSFAYTVFQAINLIKTMDNVTRFTESIYSGVTVIAYLLKLSNFLYYESHLINCLNKLTYMQENHRSNEIIVREKLATLNKLTTVFFFGAHCTVLAAALKSILSETPILPIESWYPLDWQHNSRDFWIVFVHDLFGAFIVGQVNLGLCPLYQVHRDTVFINRLTVATSSTEEPTIAFFGPSDSDSKPVPYPTT